MTLLSLTIASENDDAYERSDSGEYSSSSLAHKAHSSNGAQYYVAGFRFGPVTIPRGSTISAATLTIAANDTSNDDPNVLLCTEAVDDAPHFNVGFGGQAIMSRTPGAQQIAWVASGIGTSPTASPDIAAAIQEVTDRAGWTTGQYLAVLVIGEPADTVADNLLIRAYNHGNPADRATLAVTYSEPATTPQELGWRTPVLGPHPERRRSTLYVERPWQDLSPPAEFAAVPELVCAEVMRPRPKERDRLEAWARSWQPIEPPAPVETILEPSAVWLTPPMRPATRRAWH